jgi:hypothetical protein
MRSRSGRRDSRFQCQIRRIWLSQACFLSKHDRWGLVPEVFEHPVYDRAKGWQMDSRDFPKLPVVKALVLVTQYVSDANDRFPWSISMPFQKLPRQCTGSLGNNLRSAFYGARRCK